MKSKITNVTFWNIYQNMQSIDLKFKTIYDEESVCLFTFRILPEVCQQILLRIIYLNDSEKAISKRDLIFEDLEIYSSKNTHTHNKDNLMTYLNVLKQLSIIQDNGEYIVIEPTFKKKFRKILNVGITQINNTLGKKKKKFHKILQLGIDSLQKFIIEYFLKFEKDNYIDLKDDTKMSDFTRKRFLIKNPNGYYKLNSNAIKCILRGRDYLLRTCVGLFFGYIKDYFKNERNTTKEIINIKFTKFTKFIFQLCSYEICTSFSKLPQDYDDILYYEILNILSIMGIIYKKYNEHKKETKYFCTPLIKSIFEDVNLNSQNSESENNNGNFLIVETDFNIYAYTKNELDIKIFELLFEVNYIFDGFIAGRITREKIRNILKRDIDANQILDYLSSHSHPKSGYECIIKGNKYKIPENVAHQIIMWGDEITVLNPENVLLLYDFIDDNQYDGYMEKLKNIEIIWTDKKNRLIAVKKKYENYIKREFQNQ